MNEFKREHKKLIKEIDRQTCISRINDVMKSSGYKYGLLEYKQKVDLHIYIDNWSELQFSFLYKGAAENNQTEHLLDDIRTLLEIQGRYYQSPLLSRNYFCVPDWETQ